MQLPRVNLTDKLRVNLADHTLWPNAECYCGCGQMCAKLCKASLFTLAGCELWDWSDGSILFQGLQPDLHRYVTSPDLHGCVTSPDLHGYVTLWYHPHGVYTLHF